jgi:hypothetical protein
MGMAIGAGYVPGGIGLALLTRAVLSGMGTWELSHYGGRHEATVWLVFDPDQILANNPFLRLAAQPLVPVAQPCWYSFWS